MLFISVSVGAQDYNILKSTHYTMEHGGVSISPQTCAAGGTAKVDVNPESGYGLSRGLFYAKRNANGGLGVTKTAKNTSSYPNDRGNKTQNFEFTMPDGDVEVWAFFAPLDSLIIHQYKYASDKLKPLYGLAYEEDNIAVVKNLPNMQIVLIPVLGDDHKKTHELVDVEVTNINPSLVIKSADTVKITLPNTNKTVHVTPIFGKKNYEVVLPNKLDHIQATLSNNAPKGREEVDLTLVTDKGYIPANVTITGCKSSWLVSTERLEGGGWKTVYRFKMNMEKVTVEYSVEEVHSFSVNDTKKSNRVKAFVPEMIPGYPGVAREGQEVPVVFLMPDTFSVSYTATGASNTVVYHNVLKNSYADESMNSWTDTSKNDGEQLPVKTFTDSEGNKFWRTSGVNSMEQTVDLSKYTFPASAWENNKLKIGAIASIMPYGSRLAKVSIVSVGNGKSETQAVADLPGKVKDWVTECKLLTIDSTATKVKMLVEGQAEDINKRSYEGPAFDNLCLLLPTDGKSIKNEHVLVFKMGKTDATIEYTPSGEESTMRIVKTEHATLTLINTATDEQGTTIKAIKGDVIIIKAKADDGYCIKDVSIDVPAEGNTESIPRRGYVDLPDSEAEILEPYSINMATNETVFRYVRKDDDNLDVTPTVEKQKVMLKSYIGGEIEVDKEFVKTGETVVVTVKPKAGCQLKQIRTFPANVVQFQEVKVDKNTGAGTYSFVMPTPYITLKGEFIVPITTAQQLDSLSQQCGTFRLDTNLNLGNEWNKKEIELMGDFDGNGHRITYGGNCSLFHTIETKGSVRHLYVTANLKGVKIGAESEDNIGGICRFNKGVIEDCEVSGSVKNERTASFACGIAGHNSSTDEGGTIAYCHVLCDGLDAPMVYGVARQGKHAVIRDNVFSGMFVAGDGQAYMICNDQDSVTIERNYYVPNPGNSRGELCLGVTAKTPAGMTDVIYQAPKDYYVYIASLKSKYVGGHAITFAETANVTLQQLSPEAANAGTLVTATVRVDGNNHLESITISAPDGSDAFQCPFTDNTENVYTFSFTMPDHEVLISARIQAGQYIYTASQFAGIHNQAGLYYLARDIDLNNWDKERAITLKGTFHGRGHTIRFHDEGTAVGLFAQIAPGAELEGLHVAGTIVTTKNCGGIAYDNQGTIRNCHFCGEIKRLAGIPGTDMPLKRRIAALIYKNSGNGQIDHCSATGVLTNTGNQGVVNKNPLYAFSGTSKVTNCIWINEQNASADERQKAQAKLNEYPVYAQGILDRIDARIVTGNKSQTVPHDKTLDELTIIDGEPFFCSSDVKVKQVVYKRKATKLYDEWVLPFAFNRIAGNGTFTYREVIKENNQPKPGPVHTLTLSNSPQSVDYTFNKPWLMNNGSDGEERTYVLSNADGSPITIQATSDHRVARYASALDVGNFFAAYDTIPANIVSNELMYAWNGALGTEGEFVLPDGSTIIQPNRFYLQFYNSYSKKTIKYGQTQWAKMDNAKPATQAKAPRRLSAAVSDGWQPVFLDPREPQSITERLLDYYDIAYLVDINGEVLAENTDTPLNAVSLVYLLADGYMELPPALPLLVRAKRSDAKPLVDEKVAAELDELLTKMMEEEENIEGDGEDYDEDDFDIPHYWCASFDDRLDIWQLPALERYADLAEYGCMLFNDNYYDQSFLYAKTDDTRSTSPMSYCITLINAKTYELLPLLGDRVFVEFLQIAEDGGDVTGINTVKGAGFKVNGSESYNLNGQRVDSKYKGIIVQKGRKIFKR